jgi:hypothetical protein
LAVNIAASARKTRASGEAMLGAELIFGVTVEELDGELVAEVLVVDDDDEPVVLLALVDAEDDPLVVAVVLVEPDAEAEAEVDPPVSVKNVL